jgi:hypothetical protein
MQTIKKTLPIVFIHIDDPEYLRYTLAQTRLSNPQSTVYLIGDEYNDNYAFVKHISIKQYSAEAELFSEIYKHHSPNSYDGELFCFKRWFILREFMEHNAIHQCLYLDSDVLLYTDIEQERRKYSDCALTLSYNYGLGFNIINDIGILNEFCDFIVKCFISQALYRNLVEKAGPQGAVCDMLVFHEFQKRTSRKIGDISVVIDKTKHDANINLSEGFEMEDGVKKVTWTDDNPYCRDIKTGALIRFNSLHFQGGSKHLIKDYFRGEVHYSEDSKKWPIKNQPSDVPQHSLSLPDSDIGLESSELLEKGSVSDESRLNAPYDSQINEDFTEDIEKIKLTLLSATAEEARKAVEEAIEKYPLFTDLLTLYSELQWRANEQEDAKKLLYYITGRWPNYPEAFKKLEVFTFGESKWEYSTKFMQNALELNPAETMKMMNLINKSFTLLRPDDAETIIPLIEKMDNLIQQHNLDTGRDVLNDILFELAFLEIREPRRKGYPFIANDKIAYKLLESGFDVDNYEIDVDGYRAFFNQSKYSEDFPDYSTFNLTEKSLEHYIAAQLLRLGKKDVYIDVGNEDSPAPIIYKNPFGAETSRTVFNGEQIVEQATNIPLADESATKIALHCSFEHFEGDSDMTFLREAARVLKPGGAACIVPLYLAQEYSVVTDPVIALSQHIGFEEKTVVCCVKGSKNRFARFYDPATLKKRIQNNLGNLTLKIFRITNTDFDPSCYVQFAALLTKPAIVADRT